MFRRLFSSNIDRLKAKARSGSIEAAYALGNHLVNHNSGEAMHWFMKAADEGLPESQFAVGKLYFDLISDDNPIDFDRIESNRALHDTQMHLQEQNQDRIKLKDIKKKAQEEYKQKSMVKHSTVQDLDQAYGKRLERLLDPSSAIKETPLGIPVDHAQAIEWVRRAAQSDFPAAFVLLGNLCMQHDPALAKHGIHWYSRGAAGENPDAFYNLALLYHEGVDNVMDQDKRMAMDYFSRAAELPLIKRK